MKLSIEHHDKTFNINFTRPDETEAFLSIKGCRIAQGPKGDFVAMPASKSEKTGKWWNHAWADEKFQSAVLQMAKPLVKAPPKPAPKAPVGTTGSGFDDMDADIPF